MFEAVGGSGGYIYVDGLADSCTGSWSPKPDEGFVLKADRVWIEIWREMSVATPSMGCRFVNL